jgi:hypothetical protein
MTHKLVMIRIDGPGLCVPVLTVEGSNMDSFVHALAFGYASSHATAKEIVRIAHDIPAEAGGEDE